MGNYGKIEIKINNKKISVLLLDIRSILLHYDKDERKHKKHWEKVGVSLTEHTMSQ